MPPQSKRRRLSLLTLPVVIAVGFLLVAKLTAWQRSDLISDLADCISHGETREAMEAVHKLATIPNPPIAVLVTAAASDEHETAGAAQVSIDRLLRRWQRDVESKKRYATIASQLAELAKSLAETQTEFSDSDHVWLESTVRKILRIANKFPPTKTPLVAVHCDRMFTAIGAGRFPAGPDELLDNDEFAGALAATAVENAVPETRSSPSSALDKGASQDARGKANTAEAAMTPFYPPATTESLLRSDDDTASNLPDDISANELRRGSGGLDKGAVTDRPSSRPEFLRHSAVAPPIFRILPAMPINAPPNNGKTSKGVATDARADASSGPLANTDSRELLKRWVDSENGDIQPIERELARRGFGKLSKPLVARFFSDSPQERMRLVDTVLALPGGGSEAWLILLAGDADPDVRLFAVTFMATSNNAALVEKAWQVAIRDHDPRVADLAGRLRERRAGPLRR